jgi:hypothetical protein
MRLIVDITLSVVYSVHQGCRSQEKNITLRVVGIKGKIGTIQPSQQRPSHVHFD